jgi:hypothetical protein
VIPANRIDRRAYGYLVEFLREDIQRTLGERRGLEERWMKWHRQYKAQPDRAVKEFPFLGASNLVLPVGAIDVDTIFSRLAGIIDAPGHVWATRPLREDMVEYAPRLQEFLQWAQGAELGVYPAMADWLMELCKIGTSVLKERYKREEKLVYEFRETARLDMGLPARPGRHCRSPDVGVVRRALAAIAAAASAADESWDLWGRRSGACVAVERPGLVGPGRAGAHAAVAGRDAPQDGAVGDLDGL